MLRKFEFFLLSASQNLRGNKKRKKEKMVVAVKQKVERIRDTRQQRVRLNFIIKRQSENSGQDTVHLIRTQSVIAWLPCPLASIHGRTLFPPLFLSLSLSLSLSLLFRGWFMCGPAHGKTSVRLLNENRILGRRTCRNSRRWIRRVWEGGGGVGY